MKAKRRLMDVVYIVAVPLVIVLGVWYAVASGRQAACQSSVEFRRFESSYLHSQVGKPVGEIAGLDKVDPSVRAVVLALAPVFDATRASRAEFARLYDEKFPVHRCGLFGGG
jgi:hypothetical protein